MKIEFRTIRCFAVEAFYFWESGEDFLWLKNEWSRFSKYFETIEQAEEFIDCLRLIYEEFCCEAYGVGGGSDQFYRYVDQLFFPEKLSIAIKILWEEYNNIDEIVRQFASIAIDFEFPHNDGVKFLIDLFGDRNDYVSESECSFPF